MALDPALVGRAYPTSAPYEVGREKIREFADAIGDPNPAYRDPEAARALGHDDVIAPPTFVVVMTFRASAHLLADPDFGFALHRLLHGEQRFVHARPIRAGDRLIATMTIDAVKQAAGMEVVTTRTEVTTVDGEAVCTAFSTTFHRPEPEPA
jgi:acyl dehydratase